MRLKDANANEQEISAWPCIVSPHIMNIHPYPYLVDVSPGPVVPAHGRVGAGKLLRSKPQSWLKLNVEETGFGRCLDNVTSKPGDTLIDEWTRFPHRQHKQVNKYMFFPGRPPMMTSKAGGLIPVSRAGRPCAGTLESATGCTNRSPPPRQCGHRSQKDQTERLSVGVVRKVTDQTDRLSVGVVINGVGCKARKCQMILKHFFPTWL